MHNNVKFVLRGEDTEMNIIQRVVGEQNWATAEMDFYAFIKFIYCSMYKKTSLYDYLCQCTYSSSLVTMAISCCFPNKASISDEKDLF